MTDSAPSPATLWFQAEEEFPIDNDARRQRYIELMRHHGHIVKREPGQSRNLPGGWPHLPEVKQEWGQVKGTESDD